MQNQDDDGDSSATTLEPEDSTEPLATTASSGCVTPEDCAVGETCEMGETLKLIWQFSLNKTWLLRVSDLSNVKTLIN